MSDKPKGLRLDPLENVADGIEKLFCFFGDGVDVGSRTTISADRSVSCMLYQDGDEVVLSFDEPEPTVRVTILSGSFPPSGSVARKSAWFSRDSPMSAWRSRANGS